MIQMELLAVKSPESNWSIYWEEDPCAYQKPNDKISILLYTLYFLLFYKKETNFSDKKMTAVTTYIRSCLCGSWFRRKVTFFLSTKILLAVERNLKNTDFTYSDNFCFFTLLTSRWCLSFLNSFETYVKTWIFKIKSCCLKKTLVVHFINSFSSTSTIRTLVCWSRVPTKLIWTNNVLLHFSI
jgi:hypothetical protein